MSRESQKKITLAIIENNLAIGGVQRLAIDQLKTLSRDIFNLHLITLTESTSKNFYARVPADVVVTRLNLSGPYDVRGWASLVKVLLRTRPDIVKSSKYFSNTIARLLKIVFRYQLITAEHNTHDGNGRLQRFFNKVLNPLCYTTVVDSQMVAEYLAQSEGIPRERFTVIHNGVDIDAIDAGYAELYPRRDALRAEFGIAKEEHLFITVGRMVRQKNHLRLAEAFALVVREVPHAKLLIVGDGLQRSQVEARAESLGVRDRLVLVPARDDIRQFYVMADSMVISSDHEGFCIAAMEGLAFRVPLASTRVAGISEYLKEGENGFFSDFTAEGLAHAMSKLAQLSAEERQAFQTHARRTAERYSVAKYGEHFEQLLLECYAARSK